MEILKLLDISFNYGTNIVLQNISLTLEKGSILGILGPNGSGKTTLLKLMSGTLKPSSGKVLFKERSITAYSRKELARQIACLEQENTPHLPFTVQEIVEMGRYPWLKPLEELSETDLEIINSALACFNLLPKKNQRIDTLSGGERQLVSLARAMAQQPQMLILDEPTTYLDIGHQNMVMNYLLKWNIKHGITIIMVIHDLNLAGQFCQKLMLLNKGRIVAKGTPREVLQEKILIDTYNTAITIVKHPETGVPQFLPGKLDS